jgi:hypothetical protein
MTAIVSGENPVDGNRLAPSIPPRGQQTRSVRERPQVPLVVRWSMPQAYPILSRVGGLLLHSDAGRVPVKAIRPLGLLVSKRPLQLRSLQCRHVSEVSPLLLGAEQGRLL